MAGICDVPIISNVCCDTVGESAATRVAAPFDWLAQAIGQAASWLFQGVWALFDSTTLVDITGAGYIGVYNVMFGIAIFLMLIFFCLQLITGLVRRDAGSLGRAALGLAKSVLGSFLVITLTATLLEIVDQLSVGIIQATGTTIEEMGGKIGVLVAGLTAINLTAPGAGAIVTIFLSVLAISAAAIVWFSLLIRKALLLVAIVFAPIALVGCELGCDEGLVREMGIICARSDLLEACDRRRVSRGDQSGERTDRHGPLVDRGSDRGDRVDVHRRIRPLHGVQVHLICRLRHVSRDVRGAGVQASHEPTRTDARETGRCGAAESPRRRRRQHGCRRWRSATEFRTEALLRWLSRRRHRRRERRRGRGCRRWRWCRGRWRWCGCRRCRSWGCRWADRDRRGRGRDDRQGRGRGRPEAWRSDRPHRRRTRRSSRRRAIAPATP